MCGRYTLMVGFRTDEMEKFVNMCNDRAKDNARIVTDDSGEIRPNDYAPALMVANCRTTVRALRWGFRRSDGGLVINARSEDIKNRAMFRTLADRQRCALPAMGYYEWRDGDRLRHRIRRDGGEAFYLAGLWRIEEDAIRFVVLTRAAFGDHARVHGRMPCLLFSKEEARAWIGGAMPTELLAERQPDHLILEAHGAQQLRMEGL